MDLGRGDLCKVEGRPDAHPKKSPAPAAAYAPYVPDLDRVHGQIAVQADRRKLVDTARGWFPLSNSVGKLGECFCWRDANRNGYPRPRKHCGTHLPAVVFVVASCQWLEIKEGFVDGVDFQVRDELKDRLDDSTRHVVVKAVVGGANDDPVSVDD